MRISVFICVLLLLRGVGVVAQVPHDATLWLRVTDSGAGDLLLQEFSSENILYRTALGNNEMLNFNPVMPLSGIHGISTSLHFFPQTLVSVVAGESSDEQAVWTISEHNAPKIVMTTRRVADLDAFNYMNFPQRTSDQPLLSTYVHECQQDVLEVPDRVFHFGTPSTASLPVDQLTGSIAEVLLYDRVLSPGERNVTESYLAIKYGLTLAGVPQYVDAQGNILWDGLLQSTYHHRIAGIGRDDLTGLMQKQSTSSIEPGNLIISAGPLATDNAENDTTIPHGSFLLWGDNNAPLIPEERTGTKLLFQRTWNVTSTQWHDSLTTTVIFDKAALNTFLSAHEQFWLVIDRAGNGKFSPSSVEYFHGYPERDAIVFPGVIWDADRSGNEMFTLMIAPDVFAHVEVQQPECGIDRSGGIILGPVGGNPPYQFSVQGPDSYSIQWTGMDISHRRLESLHPGMYTIRLSDSAGKSYEETVILAHGESETAAASARYVLPEEGLLHINISDMGFDVLHGISSGGASVSGQFLSISEPGHYVVFGEKSGCTEYRTITVTSAAESPFVRCIVYPNPTPTGAFQLLAELYRPGPLEIILYTPAGHLVDRQLLHGRKTYVYDGRLPGGAGTYMVTVSAQGYTTSIPLIYR